jgi:hypothetical protein
MPAIPLPAPAQVRQISAQVGAPQSEATSEAFGGAAGTALEGLGGAIGALGQSIGEYAAKQKGKADELASATSLANSSFAPTANDITINYPDPTGKGLPETMQTAYLKWTNDQYEADIKSGMSLEAAQQAKLSRLRQAPGYTTTAANDAIKMANSNQVMASDQAAATQLADIRVHGQTSQAQIFQREKTFYDQTDKRTDISQEQKAVLKKNFSDNAAIARIQAGMEAATKSPTGIADLAALRREVESEFYTSRLDPKHLELQLNALDSAQKTMVEQQNAKLTSQLDLLNDRADKAVIPREEINAAFQLHEGLAGSITPEVERKYNEIMTKQSFYVAHNGQSSTMITAAKNAVENGQPPAGGAPLAGGGILRSAPAGTRPLAENDPRLAPVRTADGRTFMVDKRFQRNFQGFISDYEKAGGVLGPNTGTLGERPNNGSYHPIGGAIDVNQVGRGKRAGGVTLPLAVEDQIAAKWGLRSGNHFADNDNGHFDAGAIGGRGGGGAGGRIGPSGGGLNFIGALGHFESSNTNVTNPEMTSSGNARGWLQITDDTWKEFGGLATGYKTAQDAPYAVQVQIGSKIPMGRWAKVTLDKMRAAGFTIDPNKTMGENAAANGSTLAGGSGASDGAIPQAPRTAEQQIQIETADKMLAARNAGIASDPVSTMAQGPNGMPIAILDSPEGYAQRAKDYAAIKQIEPTANKPLTINEAAEKGDLMESNDTAAKVAFAGMVARWPQQMQDEMWKQIGEAHPFAAAAGRLYANGKGDLANSAFDGKTAMDEAQKGGSGTLWEPAANKWMQANMDAIMRGVDPSRIAGLQQIIKGVYASKYGLGQDLNAQNLQTVAEAVTGGTFDKVNGMSTIVPKGTNGAMFEAALRAPTLNMTDLSVTQTPPMAEDRKSHELVQVPPWDIANGHPIAIGDDNYKFMDNDGGLWHTKGPQGAQIYIAHLDAPTITKLASDATLSGASADPALTPGAPAAATAGAASEDNNPYFGSGFEPPPAPATPAAREFVTRPDTPIITQPPITPPAVQPTPAASVTGGVTIGGPVPPMGNVNADMTVKRGVDLEKIYQSNAKTFGDILKRNGASDDQVRRSVEEYIQNMRSHEANRQ